MVLIHNQNLNGRGQHTYRSIYVWDIFRKVVITVIIIVTALFALETTLFPESDRAYLAVREQLTKSNIPESYLIRIFSGSKIQIHGEISRKFKFPYEKKPYPEYRDLFITRTRIEKGIRFFRENQALVTVVADSFGVDRFILLSIAGIESNFGDIKGEFSVFNALYTIIHTIPNRAAWAAKELAEFLRYCYREQIDPHSIPGSYAGAFGFGQFIPSSFNHYAVDFNGDGIRRPHDWPDALGSIANYLVENGYEPHNTDFTEGSKNWRSILAYNHSNNYVNVVLDLRKEFQKRLTKG